MPTYAGEKTFTEQTVDEQDFDPTNGWSKVRVWVGAHDGLTDFLNSGTLNGTTRIKTSKDGIYATVRANFAIDGPGGGGSGVTPDPISRTWESVPNRAQLSVWEHPRVITVLNDYTPAQAALLRARIEQGLQDFNADLQIGENGELNFLYAWLLKKIEVFDTSRPVLRKTETVYTTTSGLEAQHANEGKYFTYAQLTEHEPTLDAARLIDAAGQKDLVWYKWAAEVRELGRGLSQIVQEYEGLGAIQTDLYEAAS